MATSALDPLKTTEQVLKTATDLRGADMARIQGESAQWQSTLEQMAADRKASLGLKYDKPREDRKFWEQILDVLQTGNYASAGLAMAIKRGDPDVWNAITRGIHDRTSYIDVAKEYGIKGKAAIGVGLVGDIFLDPLTYVPFFGATQKGRLVTRLADYLTEARIAKQIITKEDEAQFIAKFIDDLPSPKDADILREATRDGSRAFMARTFPERVEEGLQRFFTVEVPKGFYKPKIPFTGIRVPILPKFEPVGTVPFPQSVEVQFAHGLSALATATRETTEKYAPGLVKLKSYIGDKVFGHFVRPKNANPAVWGLLIESFKHYQGQMRSRRRYLEEALNSVSLRGGTAKEALERAGFKQEGVWGNIFHQVLQDAINKRLSDKERKVLFDIIEDPGRVLMGKDRDIGEMIIRDVLEKPSTDEFFRAVTYGNPQDLGKLLNVAGDNELAAIEGMLQRAVIHHGRSKEIYDRGLRAMDDGDYGKITNQLTNLQAGLLEVRKRIKPAPIPKQVVQRVLPDMPNPKPPTVPEGVATKLHGTSEEAGILRSTKVARFGDLKNRYDFMVAFSQANKSGAIMDRVSKNMDLIEHEMNKARSEIQAIDYDLINSARAAEEAKRLGQEGEKMVKAEIQAALKQPAMRQRAVDVLDDARREVEDLTRQFDLHKSLGDDARAGELADRIETMGTESLAQRAGRIVGERGLSPLEERVMVKDWLQRGQIRRAVEIRSAEDTETAVLRAMAPDAVEGGSEVADAAERIARVFEVTVPDLAKIAAQTSPIEFQARVLARLDALHPTQVGQIGEDVVGAIRNADLGEVHRLLRASVGLAPSELRLQLADLGLSEPQFTQQVGETTNRLLDEFRRQGPGVPLEIDSIHVIGNYARGEGQLGQPVEVMAFIRSELDEGDLAYGLAGRFDVKGGVLPLEFEVVPFKLTPDLNKDEVLRAFGAAPPPQPGVPPLFPTLPPPLQPISLVKQAPDPVLMETLRRFAPTGRMSQEGFEQAENIRAKVGPLLSRGKVFRTNKSTAVGVRGARHRERLSAEIAGVRLQMDDWMSKYAYTKGGALQRTQIEKLRYQLNRYDPMGYRVGGPTPREAALQAAGQVRRYRAPATKPAAPFTKEGTPVVNTATWPEGATDFLSINRDNALDVIEKRRNLLGPGKWVEYKANGSLTDKTMTDDEFIASMRKLRAGGSRTINIEKEGVELEEGLLQHAEFNPDWGVVEIADASGRVYQRALNLTFKPGSTPASASLAIGKLSAKTKTLTKIHQDLEGFASDFIRERAGKDEVARLMAGEGTAADVVWVKNELGKFEFQSVAKDGTKKTVTLSPGHVGLDVGPRGFFPTTVGTYRPANLYRIGEFVRISDIPGQVISAPTANIRRVQLADERIIDIHVDDLQLATLREVARTDHSIIDFLLHSAQRIDGTVDREVLAKMVFNLERDDLLKTHFTAELVDDLIRDLPEDMLLRKQFLIGMMEGMLRHEHSKGLLTKRLHFYISRLDMSKKKTRQFMGANGIQMKNEFFFNERATVMEMVDAMNRELKLQGVEPRWLEDALMAVGIRGTASIRATETFDFIDFATKQFAKQVSGAEIRNIENGKEGYLQFMQRVYGISDDQIKEMSPKIDELLELEGLGKAQTAELGKMARAELTGAEQAQRLERIGKLREDINQTLPDIGFYIPKGQFAKFKGAMESTPISTLIDQGKFTREELEAVTILLENNAFAEGSQFLHIPIDKLFALKNLTKHIDAFMMPKEVADFMNGHLANFTNIGEDLKPFLNVFDTVQNYWKSWTLGIFPVYHFRNVVGNIWNAFLAGAHDTEDWSNAGRFFSGNLEGITDQSGKILTSAEWDRKIAKSNILGSGHFYVETPESMAERFQQVSFKRPILDPVALVEKLAGKVPRKQINLEIGRALGQRLEDQAKVALYLDGVKRGMSDLAAAKRVRKYLFDYADISEFERNVFVRAFPFYRWSRFNIPLQLESLVTRPAKFTGAEKGIEAIRKEVGEPPQERLLPDWMQGQLPIPVKKLANGKYAYWVLGNWLPAADLVRVYDPAGFAAGMLTPLVKAPLEYWRNYSLFFKSEIERFPRETSQFLGVELTRRNINLLRNVRALNEADKLFFKKDLPQKERWIRYFFGRLYPVDFYDEAKFEVYKINRQEGALKTSILQTQEFILDARRKHQALRTKRLTLRMQLLKDDLEDLEAERKRLHISIPKKTAEERRRERLKRRLLEMGAGI